MEYILYIAAIIFLYINYKIVNSDLKYKKIPNKYLWYLLLLLPFWYIYVFFSFSEINYQLFLFQIFLTFLISFILYYFWIWAAWDAKYLLVLSLFIPYIWIVPFIWNIALITLIYLFWYFIWFYWYKITFNKSYRQSLWINIKQDLSEKWEVYKWNKWWSKYKIILKWIVIFLLIFVSIRLFRLYLLEWLFHHNNWLNRFELARKFIEKYNIYLVFLWILIFIWWLYILRIYLNKFKWFIAEKLKLNLEIVWNILLIILTIFLISFISFEYYKNPYEIKLYLFRIFTSYLALYIVFKILKWAYKITFGIAEYQYINIKNLKEGDIVDKEYLVKMFGEQLILWYVKENDEKKTKKQRKKYLLFPSPSKYFQTINNPIDSETLNAIKKCYFITNKYHKKYTPNFQENKTIKIVNTFSFAPYILWWFLLTFFFKNEISKSMINIWIEIFKHVIQK